MSWRNEVERHLAAEDTPAALLALADGLDEVWADRAKAERLQQLAQQGFEEGSKREGEG